MCQFLVPVRAVDRWRTASAVFGRGQISTRRADPRPPGPTTGRALAGCYAAALNDCSDSLSREHPVSHGLLKDLADGEKRLGVIGFDPKEDPNEGNIRLVSPQRMIAFVLCGRHNSALRPIDTCGNRFFRAIKSAESLLAPGVPDDSEHVVAFNGHDLERWLLKTLCGLRARRGASIPPRWVRMLFGLEEILPPKGVYVYPPRPGEIWASDHIRFSELGDDSTGEASALLAFLYVELVFSMHATKAAHAGPMHEGKKRTYRPQNLVLRNPGNGARLMLWFSWHDMFVHESAYFDWSPAPMPVTPRGRT